MSTHMQLCVLKVVEVVRIRRLKMGSKCLPSSSAAGSETDIHIFK